MPRIAQSHIFNFADGESISSNVVSLGGGAFGTLIVPAGLDGKTLQVITDITASNQPWANSLESLEDFHAVELLTDAKTLATGANAFSTDEIAQVGAAGLVRLKLNSAVSGDQQALLLWKD